MFRNAKGTQHPCSDLVLLTPCRHNVLRTSVKQDNSVEGGSCTPELVFVGTATWRSGTECDLTVKGKRIITVSPPTVFGGKGGYCVPEEIFAASLASCINTLYMLIARNSNLKFTNLETKASVKMHVEGLEKLIFTDVHFNMCIKLANDNERERKKANSVYQIAQKICPLRQSWGEGVPITFELNFQ